MCWINKSMRKKKEIFEDTLKRNEIRFKYANVFGGGNNYRDLIGILNDIDISKINLEEAFAADEFSEN